MKKRRQLQKINTLREYLQELDDNNYLSYNNLFAVLLRQIILDNIEKNNLFYKLIYIFP